MTETTLFMRIQNIKNGAQYTDGSFYYSLFLPPLLLPRSFPTEYICSNTIDVTFADCLLAFYLNGIQLWLAAATTHVLSGGSVLQTQAAGCAPPGPQLGKQVYRCSDPMGGAPRSRGSGGKAAARSSLEPRLLDF